MSNELNDLVNDSSSVEKLPDSVVVENGNSEGMISANDIPSEKELLNELETEPVDSEEESVEEETEKEEHTSVEVKEEETEEEEEEKPEEEVEEKPKKKKENVNIRRMREALNKQAKELKRLKAAELKRKETEYGKMNSEEKVEFLQKELYQTKVAEVRQNSKRAENEVEASLVKDFPDIHRVLSIENIAKLKDQNPYFKEMVEKTANSQGELYNKAVSAYMLMKKLGIYKNDKYAKQKKAIKNNFKKPLPANAARGSGNSGGLAEFADFKGKTEQEKKAYINRKSLMYARGSDF